MEVSAKFTALRRSLAREALAERIRRAGRLLLNPRLLICLGIAWMITNGWSYALFGVGMALKINWMRAVGGAYMSFLWLPFTPEKLLTVALAILLFRLLYPRDKKTLGALHARMARFRRGRSAG